MGKELRFVTDLNGCMICTSHSRDKDGYARIRVNKKLVYLHRYMYEQNYGEIPKGLIVRHTCDNPTCSNPKHLLLGTPLDNVRDRVIRQRSAVGERNGRAKLKERDVEEILKSNLSNYALAMIYNVNSKTIWDIRKGINWKYKKEQFDRENGSNTPDNVTDLIELRKANTQHTINLPHQNEAV